MRAFGVLTIALSVAVGMVPATATCPEAPSQWAKSVRNSFVAKPQDGDDPYVGRVRILLVTDEAGAACRTRLIDSLNPEADHAAVVAAQNWRLAPTRVSGRAVPLFSVIDFFYWRKANGKVVGTHRIAAQQTQLGVESGAR